MIQRMIASLFGTSNERMLKKIRPMVERINALESSIKPLTDAQLQAKTPEFRQRIEKGEKLDDLLPEAFAVCREAGRRVLNMRHFDVQLIGGAVLHSGRIAEMRTGEGKTLVATLACYLNALEGKGVHVVTVNDYLARRDAEWMGRLYKFLGMSVGVIVHGLSDRQRQEAYRSDITYCYNSELGFDFLRDNMKFRLEDYVQRELNFAIVDEVDSIFIDEARTPLIISGQAEDAAEKYHKVDAIIPRLKPSPSAEEEERELGDYWVDEKSRQVMMTERGVEKVEQLLGVENLFDPAEIDTLHHVNNALKAHTLFRRDVEYIVRNGEVMIVDEHTGRVMPGRRWSDGLHQAIEAKERVPIEPENQTLATITYQNFFRMYKKLGGMTGTAATEAEEFLKIYNLEVTTIPTNRAMVRTDHQDVIYKTEKEKFDAVMAEIRQNHEEGRPVLVGTVSVHKSEIVHQLLEEAGVPHNVLNAKQHDREAEIIAQAGRLGAVTIATNMAGRGTDILLGGNPEVMARVEVREMQFPEGLSPEDLEKEREAAYEKALRKYRAQCDEERKKVVGLGGLHIVGTERHEARRIDNQLRGRAGRQGDPGSSHFFLSLEDDLMRIFGGDKLRSLMTRLGMQEGEPIEHPLVTSSIERAQKRVEARNFDIRKHLLEYDDVMNSQRSTIYKLRREVLGGVQVHERIIDLIEDAVIEMADQHCSPRIPPTEWAVDKLEAEAAGLFAFKVDLQQFPREREKYEDAIFDEAVRRFEEKENKYTKELVGQVSQVLYLRTIDQYWKDHLLAMDHLREGIGLRGYGQKDPKQEYKKEGYNLFLMTLRKIRIEVLGNLFRLEVRTEEEVRAMEAAAAEEHEKQLRNAQLVGGGPPPDAAPQPETPANVQQIRLTPRSASRSAAGREEDGGGAPAGGGVPVKNLGRKIGRNEDCPCGSGKKYKKCCALDNIEYFQGADGAWVDQSGNPPARAGGGTQATGT